MYLYKVEGLKSAYFQFLQFLVLLHGIQAKLAAAKERFGREIRVFETFTASTSPSDVLDNGKLYLIFVTFSDLALLDKVTCYLIFGWCYAIVPFWDIAHTGML